MLGLGLLLALLGAQPSAVAIQQVRPVRSFTVPGDGTPGRIEYARDGQFEYLATPVGLFRSRRFADPAETAEVIAFDGRRVNAVASNGASLYVALGNDIFSTSPDSTILRSGDHGRTFSPIDTTLPECTGSGCQYLVGHRIEIVEARIFVEVGGNVLVTPDEGSHWYQLHGSSTKGVPDLQLCPVVFTAGRSTMYLGGECPLDMAWLSSGTLAPDGLSWAVPPVPFAPFLDLENRNIQFIRARNDFWAGLEGALLHGPGFALHYELGAPSYPYIRHFVEWPTDPSVRLIGGFDKADESGYLAFSRESAESWVDVSALLPKGTTNVAMLAEDADGSLLIVMQNGERYTLGTIDIGSLPPKRRSARH